MNSNTAFRISAVFGFLAVALGASGAHGKINALLVANGNLDNWKTAVLYHLVHAVVMLVISSRETLNKCAWTLFAIGITIFSGSLYALALTNVKKFGAITPCGGVCLLVGWILLALKGR